MKYLVLICVVISIVVSGSAFASEDLAIEYHCMGCHSVKEDKALPDKYGPFFTDIAKKYQEKGEKAVAQLEDSILHGSKEKWDRPVGMEPRSKCGLTIDQAHAKEMAEWIMSLAAESPAEDSAESE